MNIKNIKCSRCGKEFNPQDGCVDVLINHNIDESINWNFTVKAHYDSDDTPFVILCLGCLEN